MKLTREWYTYIHTCTHTHACTHARTHAYTHIHTYTCMASSYYKMTLLEFIFKNYDPYLSLHTLINMNIIIICKQWTILRHYIVVSINLYLK